MKDIKVDPINIKGTWKGKMIKKCVKKNVLKRRRECGTYPATARRHRRRVKMTMKNDK